jgi:hypothetical protein
MSLTYAAPDPLVTMTVFGIVALLVIVASRRSVYPGRR